MQAAADARLAARFWASVVKTDTCWLWTGTTNQDGYGRISLHRKLIAVHRLALEWQLGRSLAEGMGSLHACDIPNCVRNDADSHLFEGTQGANMADMSVKRRAPGIKLTPENIAYAQAQIASGRTQKTVASEIGVTPSTLRGALSGRTHRHVA